MPAPVIAFVTPAAVIAPEVPLLGRGLSGVLHRVSGCPIP